MLEDRIVKQTRLHHERGMFDRLHNRRQHGRFQRAHVIADHQARSVDLPQIIQPRDLKLHANLFQVANHRQAARGPVVVTIIASRRLPSAGDGVADELEMKRK